MLLVLFGGVWVGGRVDYLQLDYIICLPDPVLFADLIRVYSDSF
jgi:hypothetical protein